MKRRGAFNSTNLLSVFMHESEWAWHLQSWLCGWWLKHRIEVGEIQDIYVRKWTPQDRLFSKHHVSEWDDDLDISSKTTSIVEVLKRATMIPCPVRYLSSTNRGPDDELVHCIEILQSLWNVWYVWAGQRCSCRSKPGWPFTVTSWIRGEDRPKTWQQCHKLFIP